MEPGRVECVTLDVDDINKAVDFYDSLLGIAFNPITEHVRKDGTKSKNAWSPSFGLELIESDPRRKEGMRGFAVRAKDINKYKAEMAKRGIPIANESKLDYGNEHEVSYALTGFNIVFSQHDDWPVLDPTKPKPTPIGTVDNVILNVRDVEKSAEFWSGLLEIEFDPIDEHVSTSGTKVRIRWCPLYGLELIESNPPLNEGMRGVAIRVKDIDAAKAAMAKKGMAIVSEIESQRAREHEVVYNVGGYRFIFTQHDDY